VERLASDLLDETEDAYLATMKTIFGGVVDQEKLSKAYAKILAADGEGYQVETVIRYIQTEVDRLGHSDSIVVVRGSRSGVSTNVTTLYPRVATIFIAESPGLESFRAACHALGHAIYAVHSRTLDEDLLGVNIAATEVCAFMAQELALAAVDAGDRVLMDLMPTYYARLYALRLLDEARYYREGPAFVADMSVYVDRLAVIPAQEFAAGKRIAAVDFVIGFAAYLRGPATMAWDQIECAATSNGHLVNLFRCMAAGVTLGESDNRANP
jgi:hypothetical protein